MTYTLQRKDPKTGFLVTMEYSGNIQDKPTGWTLSSKRGPQATQTLCKENHLGFIEKIEYSGPAKNKPANWKTN